MLKKILSIVIVIALFCCNNVYAYEYQNESSKEKVEEKIEQIRDKRDFYEWLSDTETTEEINEYSMGGNTWWWPIGSKETTTSNGKTFATGEPSRIYVSSSYGPRRGGTHGGVDLLGTGLGVDNIIATRNGVVTKVVTGCTSSSGYCFNVDTGCTTANCSCGGSYGNYIYIDHQDGTMSVYAHLYEGSITVKEGDTVLQGQVIAKIGSSGCSSGTHLHFEIRVGGERVNPEEYIDKDNPRPSSEVTGDDNVQSVCLTLRNSGYSVNATAAIMRNVYAESNFNPLSYNEKEDAIGLCQWRYERKNLLKSMYGETKDTAASQAAYIVYELDNQWQAVRAKPYLMDSSYSVAEMTYQFCNKFEVAAGCEARKENADMYVSYVSNGCKE